MSTAERKPAKAPASTSPVRGSAKALASVGKPAGGAGRSRTESDASEHSEHEHEHEEFADDASSRATEDTSSVHSEEGHDDDETVDATFGATAPSRKKGEKLKRSPELFKELKDMVETHVTDKVVCKDMMRLIKCFAGKHGVVKKEDPHAGIKPLDTWPCFMKVFSMYQKRETEKEIKLLTSTQKDTLLRVFKPEHVSYYTDLKDEKTTYVAKMSKLFSREKGDHKEVYIAFANAYEPMLKPLKDTYRSVSGKAETKTKAPKGGARLASTLDAIRTTLGEGDDFEKVKAEIMRKHEEATAKSTEARRKTIAEKNAKVDAYKARLSKNGVTGAELEEQVKAYKASLTKKGKATKAKEAKEESEAELDVEEEPVKAKKTTKAKAEMFTLVEVSDRYLKLKDAKKTDGMKVWEKTECAGWEDGEIAVRPHTHVMKVEGTKGAIVKVKA